MHIHLITHAGDRLIGTGKYMIAPILKRLHEKGHVITIGRGIPAEHVEADLAIMHVDLTYVPPEYIELGKRYPRCLNLAAQDISKRRVSGAVLPPGTEWDGRVLVKNNLNCASIPELRAGIITERPSASPPTADPSTFYLYESLHQVPLPILSDPYLVVERFLPEQEDGEYACRFWTFCGDKERCARVFSRRPIVKAENQIRFEMCDVPDDIRKRRDELGFDFGKFDFVVHEGKAILLDANKTPGLPPVSKESVWPLEYAEGLLTLAG